ncbi:MAG: hypothetical protein ACXWG1_02260 [Usitatibacter sp.]
MSETAQDKLDKLLRRDALAAIDDGGFTARVMQALPPRTAPHAGWLKPALVLGSTALGSALAWLFAPGSVGSMQGFVDLASSHVTPAAIATLGTAGALVVCAIVLAAHTD